MLVGPSSCDYLCVYQRFCINAPILYQHMFELAAHRVCLDKVSGPLKSDMAELWIAFPKTSVNKNFLMFSVKFVVFHLKIHIYSCIYFNNSFLLL